MAFVDPRMPRTDYLDEARKLRDLPDHKRATGLRWILWWGLPRVDDPERLVGEDELFDLAYGDAGALYWHFTLSGNVPLEEFCGILATHLTNYADEQFRIAEELRACLTLDAVAEQGRSLVREVSNGASPLVQFIHAEEAARWFWERPRYRHLVPPSLARLWRGEPAEVRPPRGQRRDGATSVPDKSKARPGRPPVVREGVKAKLLRLSPEELSPKRIKQIELAERYECSQGEISRILKEIRQERSN